MGKAKIERRLAGVRVMLFGRFGGALGNRLEAMVGAMGATGVDVLDKRTNFLVIPMLAAEKKVQNEAAALNKAGAKIRVMDMVGFDRKFGVKNDDLIDVLRMGTSGARLLNRLLGLDDEDPAGTPKVAFVIKGANFQGQDLSGFNLTRIGFERCNFAKTLLKGTMFGSAVECDFTQASGDSIVFDHIAGSCFQGAVLKGLQTNSRIAGVDFSAAKLAHSNFGCFTDKHAVSKNGVNMPAVFRGAKLRGLSMEHAVSAGADFAQADLTDAVLRDCHFVGANFRSAILTGARFYDCKFERADFSDAALVKAEFPRSNLNGANVHGADLRECNLRGTAIRGVNLQEAKNFTAQAIAVVEVGPAMKELGEMARQARRLVIQFRALKEGMPLDMRVRCERGCVTLWSAGVMIQGTHQEDGLTGKLADVGTALPGYRVDPSTIQIKVFKSPVGSKQLLPLVERALDEAFTLKVPTAQELAAAAHRWKSAKTQARKVREKWNRAADEKIVAIKKTDRAIKKMGVTDVASFMTALGMRVDASKLARAKAMLKDTGFKLFDDICETHLAGVVKSQTDPNLVYACRLDDKGNYACCTQNLNICGGLQGSVCKHMLVLMVGLVKAKKLDPAKIDQWIVKTRGVQPLLDKEKMGEILIRYKGAEAGEVDWRPTETLPEDYYTL